MKSTIALFLTVVVLPCCWADSDVVATYGGEVVTLTDLNAQRLYGRQKRLSEDPNADVEAIVIRRALADRLSTLPPLTKMVCDEWRMLRESGLFAAKLKRQVSEDSRPEFATVRAYYENNLESYRREKRWRLLNIFLRTSQGSSIEERIAVRKRLEELRSRISDGEDFGALARSESDSPSAISGGRMGSVPTSQLHPAAAAVVEHLEPGELSEIIETEDGFTILRCLDVRAEEVLPFEDVQERIAIQLKRSAFSNAWSTLNRKIHRRVDPLFFLQSTGGDQGEDIVLSVRVSPRTCRVSRAGYVHWASNRDPSDPSIWSNAKHDAALRELSLVIGRADEARRRGLAIDSAFRDRLEWEREHIVAECVMDHEIRLMIDRVSESEVAAAYLEHRETLTLPESRDLDILRVEITPTDPQALYRKLQGLAADVRVGITSLEEAAVALTVEGHDARFDSLLGVPPRGVDALGRSAAEAVATLTEGKISDPIQDTTQLLIIRVVAIHPSRALSLEEATPRLRRYLERTRSREARRAIEVEILAEQEIAVY